MRNNTLPPPPLHFLSWLEVGTRTCHGFSNIQLHSFTVGTWKRKENLAPKNILFLKFFSLRKSSEISFIIGGLNFYLFIYVHKNVCFAGILFSSCCLTGAGWAETSCVLGRACTKGMTSWPMWWSPPPLQRYSALVFVSSCIKMEILACFNFHRSPFHYQSCQSFFL